MRKKMKPFCKRLLSGLVQGAACISLAVLVVLLFAHFDLGRDWEEIKATDIADIFSNQRLLTSYFALIGFRLALYLLPALLVAGTRCFYNRKKIPQNKRKMIFGLLANTYSVQFFAFSVVLAAYELFGCDYLLGANILNKMNSFTFVVGLVAALVIDKKLPIKQIYESAETQKL